MSSPEPAPPLEPATACRRASFRVDVSEVVPLAGRFEIAVDAIVPRTLPAEAGVVVLVGLPGGFLSRRYFDLEIDGDRRTGFAEAMAREGYVTLALDPLGVGDSSRPDPIERGYVLGVETIARASQCALEKALERLRRGGIGGDAPPLRPIATVGVGHSMGSMLTVEQQALARAHRALVLFSFSTAGTPAFLDDALRAYANDPARTRREAAALLRRSMGSPYPGLPALAAGAPARTGDTEAKRVAAFGVGSAPDSAEEALQRASTSLLGIAGLLSMIPGAYAPSAEKVDVPVLIAIGDHDLHDERGLAAMLPLAPEVTTFVLEDCWHCHFVANRREILFRRVADWIRTTLDPILHPTPERTFAPGRDPHDGRAPAPGERP